jgi:membrane peptidoglycan carboxypeptidase
VWQALKGSDVQGGGSTITQQYVKNYFLTQDRTLDRKLREMVIAIKIDRDLSKDQILEGYLNTIYYGRGAYGIQAAAKAYFNKDASALSVAEGAVLASVMNAPSLFDPALGEKQKTNLTNRWGYVMDGMVVDG